MIAQEDDPEKPPDCMSGALRMHGSTLETWQDRFCRLDKNHFYISKSADPFAPSDVIAISEETEINFDHEKSQMTIKTPTNTIVFTGPRPEIQSWVLALRICNSNSKLSMDNFRVIRVLGREFYGKSMLVEKLDTGDVFALKSIRKEKLFQLGQVDKVLTERVLLSTLKGFPFIANLSFAFQSDSKFYLGFEYPVRGALLYHLQSLAVLAIDDMRLYLAELILALEYVHKNQIIYRDLKPQNVLLSKTGHIKLADFATTSTFYGAEPYRAPEVIQQQEYGFKADWWAFGVLFYEIMFGSSPFWNDNEDRTFDNILHSDPEYPEFGHNEAIDLMKKLLVKDPVKRIDVNGIKAHPFFDRIDWENVLRLEVKPSSFQEVTNEDQSTSSGLSEITLSGFVIGDPEAKE